MEQTIDYIMGKFISITYFDLIEITIREKVAELDDNFILLTEEYFIKGPIVKYGFLDITFKKKDQNEFLKIFAKTNDKGYFCDVNKNRKAELPKLQEYFSKYMNNIDLLFPVEFEIIDCCKTNNEWIWSDKYFYS